MPERLIKKVEKIKAEGRKVIPLYGLVIGFTYLHDCLEINSDHTKLTIEAKGLSRQGDLICLGGICVNPSLSIGAKDVQEILDSWQWLVAKLRVEPYGFMNAIEKATIAKYLLGGTFTPIPHLTLGLGVDLHRLHSGGVNISHKLKSIKDAVKGHIRKANRQVTDFKSLEKIASLLNYLDRVASELRLGVTANIMGYNVTLGESPDLAINGVPVEVKTPHSTESGIRNAIESGLKRSNLVAINQLKFNRKWIEEYSKTIMAETSLQNALNVALSLSLNKKRCALFYGLTYDGSNIGYAGRVVILK